MNKRFHNIHRAALAAVALFPVLAHAHTGVGQASGFLHGLLHPVSGLDHLLAMLAVGAWALHVGGRAVWALPAAFVGLMLGGAGLALAGVSLPAFEPMIALSVVVLGGVIAFGVRMPVVAGSALVGLFGLFHGFAHGSELATPAAALGYGVGFVITTSMLHLAGIGFASLLMRGHERYLKLAGGVVAGAGVALGLL
ncbi:HupE/UreJ family protein [Endothiovibrio diazotrophicus]